MNFVPNASNYNPSSELDDARKTMDSLYELSKLLRCDIDKHTLSLLISMTDSGVNPDHLAAIVGEAKRKS
jgi:mitotic-spindle organizing protein 1